MFVDQRMTSPPSQQPAIRRKGSGSGKGEREGEAAPEQRFIETGVHRTGYDEHNGVVHDLMMVMDSVSAAKASPRAVPVAMPARISGRNVSA